MSIQELAELVQQDLDNYEISGSDSALNQLQELLRQINK